MEWNNCATPNCTKKTRYKTGKLCATCQKRRETSGDSHRVSAMSRPWNRCQTCPQLATYRGGSQCANCAQKKYWAKDKQKNKDRCAFYYLKNRDKERARRRKYYQEHREEEILNAQLYRLNKERKQRQTKDNLPPAQSAPTQPE